MLKQKDAIQFRSLLMSGMEYELLSFIAKMWMPKGSAEVVVRSVDQKQCMVLELIDDSGLNPWLFKSLSDTPLSKFIHAHRGHYIRFVVPLEDAGWIRHRHYEKVDRSKNQWLNISEKVIYRKPLQ